MIKIKGYGSMKDDPTTKHLSEMIDKETGQWKTPEMSTAAEALRALAELDARGLETGEPAWEDADTIDEGEHLFVYVHQGVAHYGVGIKAWSDADDRTKYVVGNFPWAGRPTHAMKLPSPPSGQTRDQFLRPAYAQLRARIFKEFENEIARLRAALCEKGEA